MKKVFMVLSLGILAMVLATGAALAASGYVQPYPISPDPDPAEYTRKVYDLPESWVNASSPADFNQDGSVNLVDFEIFKSDFALREMDLNGNGVIDKRDLLKVLRAIIRGRYIESCDFNWDGVLDMVDFGHAYRNFGYQTTDMSGDGMTDILDFSLFRLEYVKYN